MNSAETSALEAVDLVKIYSMPGTELTVLSGLHFKPRAGAMTAVVGASGTGKSTLLHILGTLDRPTRGKILYQGEDLFSLSSRALARHRNRLIGFVFQFHHLLPEFTALENVMMPGLVARRPQDEIRDRASNLLKMVGLQKRTEHRPGELSGGEQQRVAVARALFNEPLLLLADEPSGNLDRENSQELHRLLRELVQGTGQTTVVATHDERLAAEADEVYRLSEGKLHPLRVLADNGSRVEESNSARNQP